METNGLNEAQLDLVYFALNHAVSAARTSGTELPFAVADRSAGREVTWLENAAEAADLDTGDRMVVVQHTVLPSSNEGEETPAIVVELTDGDVVAALAQPYRPGGSHRRFSTLGEPFDLHLQPA